MANGLVKFPTAIGQMGLPRPARGVKLMPFQNRRPLDIGGAMSELATVSQLAASSAQLPVNWYLDQGIFELEQKLLFSGGPGYIGHELMVPNSGDYHTLQWMDHAKALVKSDAGVELLSNVCRHRQAIMLEGRGNAKS